jgi:hypothetical protein
LLLLAILGWWRFFRQAWLDALLCLAVVGTVYFVFAQFSFWHGDGSWGPRYIYIALPVALVPMIGLLDGARFQRWRIALVTFVVVCGVVVQLLGVLVNFEPKDKHPGFPRDVLAYDWKQDVWSRAGELPFSLVTTPAVEWRGKIVIPGGEARPGKRSPEVW